jgi:lipopolysaccharide export system protein LptC
MIDQGKLPAGSKPQFDFTPKPGMRDARNVRQFANLMSARRYTGFVRSMRIALPTLALLTLGLIVIWPGLQSRVGGVQLSFANIESVNSELRMMAPRLTGTDKQNRPYTITAKTAVPEINDSNLIKLDSVDGDMTLADGTWVNLTAPFGVYDKFLRRLELSGPIAFNTDKGYEINARSASVDLSKGSIISNEPIALQGPFGTLEANEARLTERGGRIHFDGNVHGIFMQALKDNK